MTLFLSRPWVPLILSTALVLCTQGCTGEFSAQVSPDPEGPGSSPLDTPSLPTTPPGTTPGTTPTTPPGTTPGTPPKDSMGPLAPSSCAMGQAPGDSLMRRLSRQELETTLSQLFEGLPLEAALSELPGDEKTGVFSLNTSPPSLEYVAGARHLAETLAQELAQDPKATLGCGGGGELKACVRAYLEKTFWPVAIQRPAERDELDDVMALYDAGQKQGGAEGGVRFVFEALLQSPSFLYKGQAPVSGTGGQVVRLGEMELAYRMAALFWRGVPDQELLLAASRGELQSPAGRGAQAKRMLEDPLGKLALGQMLMQWFDLDSLHGEKLGGVKDAAQLAASMVKESSRFIDHVVEEEGANYKTLLGAKYSFMDQRLAQFHGVDTAKLGEKDAQGMWRMDLNKRAGLLTHASVLSQQHGTIFRGKLVRLNILCGGVADLEDQSLIDSIKTEDGESERSQAQKRLAHPTCSGCHRSMEPLGLPFDVFDELGRYRSKDQWGNPVHGGSSIVNTGDIDGEVESPAEFVGKLVESKEVEQCMAEQLFTYSFARKPKSADRCAVGEIQTALSASQGSLSAALLVLVQSEAFATTTTVSKEQ